MPSYLMGIDEGTMSSRASVFGPDGTLLGSAAAEYGVTSPKPGWYEQDCEAMTAVIYNACRSAIRRAGIKPADIAAVALSSQGAAFVPVDKDNRILRPCLGWQDTRGTLMYDKMRPLIAADEYYRISGIPYLSSAYSIAKVLWLREYEPDVWERTACLALHQDYFLTALGVEGHYVDIASASRYGFFDVDHNKYSDRLLSVFDIPEDMLAKVVPGGTQVGEITPAVSEHTGIPTGTPICVGAMDVNASILGLGVVEPGMAGTILGTYGTCIALSDKAVRDPAGSLVVMGNVGTNGWTIEGASLAAASSYRWYRDTFGDLEKAAGTLLGEDPFDLINSQIERTKPGARGLLFIPHLASAGAPRNNTSARGLLLGLTLVHTKGEVARAVMEGISLEIRDMIAAHARAGIDLREVRMTGGGTKSSLWNQIQANVYGVTTATTQTAETGSLGAAMLAGVGAGIFTDVYDAVRAMVKVTHTHEPDPETMGIYNDLYGIYTSAYEALEASRTYDLVAELQSKLGA